VSSEGPEKGVSALKTWHKVAIALGAVGFAGVVVPRYLWFRRTRFPQPCERGALEAADHHELAIAHMRRGHKRLVVTAHGLLRSMNDHNMVSIARALAEHFDVIAFDFPGHGASPGVCAASFANAAQDLRRVIDHGRALGYERIGVIGYSMGAAAAILAAAEGAPVDAVVSVSCPGSLPQGVGLSGQLSTWPWRWWARLMGTRVTPRLDLGPLPVERVGQVAPIPLLIVHCGLDTLVRREGSETLFAVARPPKDYLYVPGALHAMPTASAAQIVTWLGERIPGSQSVRL